MTTTENYHGQCECGNASFTMHSKPLLRIICHCTICQEFNQAPFADILIFPAKDVDLPEKGKVNYKNYSKPPMVERGKCANCDKPAIEYIKQAYAPSMVIVPSANVADKNITPEVSFHSFYHRRHKDHEDDFLKSQAGFMWQYFKAKKKPR
jgi:hypothetical protein